MRLQHYDFVLHHRNGEGNPADVLSGQPLPQTSFKCGVADQYVNFMETKSVPKSMSLKQIASETHNDEELQEIRASLKSGVWQKSCPYYSRHELLETGNGIILRGTKIVMPKTLQRHTLQLAHKGHQGIVKTKQLLRSKVWWAKIDKCAENYVRQCHACQILSHGDLHHHYNKLKCRIKHGASYMLILMDLTRQVRVLWFSFEISYCRNPQINYCKNCNFSFRSHICNARYTGRDHLGQWSSF